MPSATAYVNKAPLFFCSAGDKDNCPEALKSHTDTTWPQGKEIRIKILSGQNVLPAIQKIINSTLEQWKKGLSDNLMVRWVGSDDEAEIRLSFRNDQPHWSAVGARAVYYDQDKATLNFSFGHWEDQKAIFSHAMIMRAAAHLLGHALGLPHATVHWSSPWDQARLETDHGSFWSQVMRTEPGSSSLRSEQSIMAYDRPGHLSSNGRDERHGGSVIDSESLSLLQSLYPPMPSSPYHSYLVNSQTAGWREGIGTISATKWFGTTATSNIVTGLTRLDMGINGNFRVSSYCSDVRDDGFSITQGCWADTHIIDASCDVLSFASDDTRVQTGREQYSFWKGGVDAHGQSLSRRINFGRAWKTTTPPSVVAWIAGIDYWNRANVRCEVVVDGVDANGFTLHLNTWLDSLAYNIEACWLAHEQDDYTIRSGLFDPPHFDPETRMHSWVTNSFSSPLRRAPKLVFHALTFIDVPWGRNLRFNFDVSSWNASGVTGTFSSWVTESAFYCLRGCYIAVL